MLANTGYLVEGVHTNKKQDHEIVVNCDFKLIIKFIK